MERTFAGRCLCGDVTFQASGKPVVVAQCHCEECRRLSGTGHASGAMFSWADVQIEGELGRYDYTSASGSTVTKTFCRTCGSSIYGTNSHSPGHLTLSLGAFDPAPELDIEVVIFERDKPRWDMAGPDVMRFDTQPSWSPDD